MDYLDYPAMVSSIIGDNGLFRLLVIYDYGLFRLSCYGSLSNR